MANPKILFYDLETTPNLGYTWGKYQQNVLAFTKRRELLSFAYSYEGSTKVECLTRQGKKTDKKLVTQLHRILQSADIVVAHNGDSFDHKVARARMLFHGLPPIKPLISIDTKKAAYNYFMFDGNALDDLCQYLGIGKKHSTSGFSLWEGCMRGDRSAWATMVKYNKHDVVLLKKVYEKLRPWIANHPRMDYLTDPSRKDIRCPNCAGTHVIKRGLRVAIVQSYQRWQCLNTTCGAWFSTALGKGYGRLQERLRKAH